MSSQYTLFEFDDGSCDVDSLRIVLNGKVEKGENVCHGRNVLFMLGSVAKCVAPSVWFPGRTCGISCLDLENLLTGQIVSALFGRIISLICTYNLMMLLFAVLLIIQHDVYVMSLR